MARPSAGITGSSKATAGGSIRELSCCGFSSTRLAQRVRAVILPSVSRVSPLCNFTRCRVQYTRFPMR